MKKQPAFQFYTGDWLKDPALSICTPATRGIWMDLLCAMHEAGRVGWLRGTSEQLARVSRCSPADLTQALTDLQITGAADVADRNGVVTVTCRRMLRDSKLRRQNLIRQHRKRGVTDCNEDVTPYSSSSSSPSVISTQRDSGPDPALVAAARGILRESGLAMTVGHNTEGWFDLLQLVKGHPYERVLRGCVKAVGRGAVGHGAIRYAAKCVSGDQAPLAAEQQKNPTRDKAVSIE